MKPILLSLIVLMLLSVPCYPAETLWSGQTRIDYCDNLKGMAGSFSYSFMMFNPDGGKISPVKFSGNLVSYSTTGVTTMTPKTLNLTGPMTLFYGPVNGLERVCIRGDFKQINTAQISQIVLVRSENGPKGLF